MTTSPYQFEPEDLHLTVVDFEEYDEMLLYCNEISHINTIGYCHQILKAGVTNEHQ